SGQGLYRYNPANGSIRDYRHDDADPNSLSNDVVQRLLVDRAGTLWVSTWDGFDRFDMATEHFKTYRADPWARSLEALPLAEDPDGPLWPPSTASPGLLRFDPRTETFQLFRYDADPAGREGNDKVNTIHIAGADAVWWGTQNGLYRLNPTTGAT